MSTPTAANAFAPLDDIDLATPGDPFVRLRYSYGQLLGAEDFTTEQRYFLLRSRLHNAALHGFGTVWGLKVGSQESETALTLTCETGLAIDPLGREIYVPQKVCLDITGLAATAFWKDLSPPQDDPASDAIVTRRRVYVVLRYRAGLTEPVPAITRPCSDQDAGLSPSRVQDGYRLCLEATTPDLTGLPIRDITTRVNPPGDIRTRILDQLIDLNVPPPARVWSGTDDAPLLLAVLDLDPVDELAGQVKLAGTIDNSVRALLPAVQMVADLALATHLEVAGNTARLQAGPPSSADGTGRTIITVPVNRPLNPDTLAIGPVRVLRFDTATKKWTSPTLASVTATAGAIAIVVDEPWPNPTAYQVALSGTGELALLAADGQPFAGAAGEAVPAGTGRDAHLFATHPTTA